MEILKNKISLGCGSRELGAEYFRVDLSSKVKPDLVHNLDVVPWPLPSKEFVEVECMDVVEHVQDICLFMEEVHRILKLGGKIIISTPHYSSNNSFTDPTHRHHLGYFSFDYFTREHHLRYYSKAEFKIVHRNLVFRGNGIGSKLLSRWANRYPEVYERRFAWMFPAWFLYFELESVEPTVA